eukprot:6200339-Pleurochrysis_carterae.AAC.5
MLFLARVRRRTYRVLFLLRQGCCCCALPSRTWTCGASDAHKALRSGSRRQKSFVNYQKLFVVLYTSFLASRLSVSTITSSKLRLLASCPLFWRKNILPAGGLSIAV